MNSLNWRVGKRGRTLALVSKALDEGLSVAAVARRLGIAPATLRTWARRYGLGPTGHEAGLHRRYSEDDLERLAQMRRLVLAGRTPAEAAKLACGQTPVGRARHGGGHMIALPADDQIRGLARAALALDHEAIHDQLQALLAERGAIGLWRDVVVPVMVSLGERWKETGGAIEVEHTLSESIIEVLGSYARSVKAPINLAPIVLASADEEQHSLPLYALAAALAERHITSRIVGARTPPSALAAAVRRTGPAAVFIWSQLSATGDATQLHEFPVLRPAPRIVVGGPGWDHESLPNNALWVNSLEDAVAAIMTSMGQ